MICNILQINSAFFFPTNIRHFQPNSNVCVLVFSPLYILFQRSFTTLKQKQRSDEVLEIFFPHKTYWAYCFFSLTVEIYLAQSYPPRPLHSPPMVSGIDVETMFTPKFHV